jgi:flavin-binding protein dodecin
VVGTSPDGFTEAAKAGIEEAGRTLQHMNWFQVVEMRGSIRDGKATEFQVTMKIGFKVER